MIGDRSSLAAVALVASLLCHWPFDADTAHAEVAPQAPAEVVVATKEAPPFAMKSADGQWHGIAIELWTRIADKLGMHTSFNEYATVPEMLAAVSDGKANAAIAAITVTSDRERVVDFSQPYFQSGLGVAVPARKEIDWFTVLSGIFTLRFFEAVGVLVSVAVIVGSLVWVLERKETEHFSGGAKGLGTGLWWSASAMT